MTARTRWWTPLLRALTHVAGLVRWRQTRQGTFRGVLIRARRRFVARVKHTPSGVQDGNRYQNRPRIVAASLAALKATGLQIRRTARRLPWVVQFGAEDANKDFHRATWREEYDKAYGQMTGAWDARQPKGGTHAGRRLIDYLGALGRGVTVTRSWISTAPKPHKLDHTGMVMEISVAVRRRLGHATTTVAYRVGYASGKFNAPVDELAQYLHDMVHLDDLDLLWSDEAEQPHVVAVVQKWFGPDFTVEHAGEYLQISRNATVRVTPRQATVT